MAGKTKQQQQKGPSRGKRQKIDAKPTATASTDSKHNDGFFQGLLAKLRSSMGHNRIEKMTAGEVLTQHPLIRVGKFVFIPYLLYLSFYYLRLQHPEYISKATLGLINLRPSIIGTDTPRQMLIVATPGSGTVQMSSELKNKLSLEIGHESTDAAWDYTRDGSISWFHGMRFLSKPKDSKDKISAIAKICNADYDTIHSMGFHPAMYGPPRNKCSYRSKWDECWKSECFVTLLKEWGCGITNTCEINFQTNIHQVRNPMNTLQSLVAKYCVGGVDGTVAAPFLTYASAFFPSHDFHADSCIEATGTFMVMYSEAMIDARAKGYLDGYFQIEESSACDVAKIAGLLSSITTVYQPNYIRINKLCGDNSTKDDAAQKVVEQKLNKVNKDQVRLGWNDLKGGKNGSKRRDGDRTLESSVKNLFTVFKYDDSSVPNEWFDVHTEL